MENILLQSLEELSEMSAEEEKESIRAYLKQTGVIDTLAEILNKMWESDRLPIAPLEFIREELGAEPVLDEYFFELEHEYDEAVRKEVRLRRILKENGVQNIDGDEFDRRDPGYDEYCEEYGEPYYQEYYDEPQYRQEYNEPHYHEDYNEPQYREGYDEPQYHQEHDDPQYCEDYNERQYHEDYDEPQYHEGYDEPQYHEGYNEPQYHEDYDEPQYDEDYDEPQYHQEYDEQQDHQEYDEQQDHQEYDKPQYQYDEEHEKEGEAEEVCCAECGTWTPPKQVQQEYWENENQLQ